VWGPSKYEFEGPHGDQSEVTSPIDQSFRQFPPASSPAVAVSRLTVWNLGFVRSRLPSREGVKRFLHGLRRVAQPLMAKKFRQFFEVASYPQNTLVHPPIRRGRPPAFPLLHTLSPGACAQHSTLADCANRTAPIRSVDITPTILRELGIAPHTPLDGRAYPLP
jgi:hypothetical protein